MAGITLAQAEAQLAAWLTALEAVRDRGQSYTIGDRTLTRADLAKIEASVTIWERRVQRLSRGGIRVRLGTPVT